MREEIQLTERSVTIPVDGVQLDGDLVVPETAHGLVAFAHGSGSSRRSPRNRYVAGVLQEAGLATLLFDLMTEAEGIRDEWHGQLRFDIPFLAQRLIAAGDWLARQEELAHLPLGYFGSSTGAAAALVAAAERARQVHAVVSRGGRPDLAGDALARVEAPTLLLVGGDDREVIELNEQARREMNAPVELEIVPGASHLFSEPGTLEEVARRAAKFFRRHLVARPAVIMIGIG
jgi:dienelactone hydrolase